MNKRKILSTSNKVTSRAYSVASYTTMLNLQSSYQILWLWYWIPDHDVKSLQHDVEPYCRIIRIKLESKQQMQEGAEAKVEMFKNQVKLVDDYLSKLRKEFDCINTNWNNEKWLPTASVTLGKELIWKPNRPQRSHCWCNNRDVGVSWAAEVLMWRLMMWNLLLVS